MQTRIIYREGDTVYAKGEGNGTEKRYIEEIKNGVYKLRTNEKKGVGVLDKEFPDVNLSEEPSKETPNCGKT